MLATAETEVSATAEVQTQTLEEQFIRFYRQRNAGAMSVPKVIRLFLELAVPDFAKAEVSPQGQFAAFMQWRWCMRPTCRE